MQRREFLKTTSQAVVGVSILAAGEKIGFGQQKEKKQETKTITPELRTNMSKEEGEKQLREMAATGKGKLKRTAFLSSPGDKGQWIVIDDEDNTKALMRGADVEAFKNVDITLYRVGEQPIKPYTPPNENPRPPTEQRPPTDHAEFVEKYLPNLFLSGNIEKDWNDSDILTSLYLAHKVGESKISSAIATPVGFIKFTLDTSSDHWVTFINAFKTAEEIIQQFEEASAEIRGDGMDKMASHGKNLRSITMRSGPDKLNQIKRYLDKEIDAMTLVLLNDNRASVQIQSNILNTQKQKAERAINRCFFGVDDIDDGTPTETSFSRIREKTLQELFDRTEGLRDGDPKKILKPYADVYSMAGIKLSFEFDEDWDKKALPYIKAPKTLPTPK